MSEKGRIEFENGSSIFIEAPKAPIRGVFTWLADDFHYEPYGGSMSTRQQGNRTENLVAAHLEEKYGYYCYPSRGSRGIDLVCLAPDGLSLPHLGLEIGTESKSVRAAFEKLHDARRFPGMVYMVVRKLRQGNGRIKLRWHATDGEWGFDGFEACLERARQL